MTIDKTRLFSAEAAVIAFINSLNVAEHVSVEQLDEAVYPFMRVTQIDLTYTPHMSGVMTLVKATMQLDVFDQDQELASGLCNLLIEKLYSEFKQVNKTKPYDHLNAHVISGSRYIQPEHVGDAHGYSIDVEFTFRLMTS